MLAGPERCLLGINLGCRNVLSNTTDDDEEQEQQPYTCVHDCKTLLGRDGAFEYLCLCGDTTLNNFQMNKLPRQPLGHLVGFLVAAVPQLYNTTTR